MNAPPAPGLAARLPPAGLLALVLALGACVVPEVDLGNKACDQAGKCAEGYFCDDQRLCQRGTRPPDAGPPPPDAGAGLLDAGPGSLDAGPQDGGPEDGGPEDGGPEDAGQADGGPADGGSSCQKGQSRPCGSNVGLCRQGTETCGEDGTFGPCQGGVPEAPETCDNQDNNCNGTKDEGLRGAACEKTQGVCAGATRLCQAGAFETPCTQASYGPDYEATETRCDGKDNDCNGTADQGLLGGPCELTLGVCMGSRKRCQGGSFEAVCATVSYPSTYEPNTESRCDGLDNNCDGTVDEGLDADRDGYGRISITCTKGTSDCDDQDPSRNPGAMELCDGKDNNCNGAPDDGPGMTCVAGTGQACSSCNGGTGQRLCNATCNGYSTTCTPPQEICDGIDNDCNGLAESYNSGIGNLTGNTGDASQPALVGLPTGRRFVAAYTQAPKATPTQHGVFLVTVDENAVGGASPLKVAQGTAPVAFPALSRNHVAWIERGTSPGNEVVWAATWSATNNTGGPPTLTAGAPFLVHTGPGTFSRLVVIEQGSNTLLAFVVAPSGGGQELKVVQLSGTTVGTVRSVTHPVTGGNLRDPAFGVVAGSPVLYYTRVDTSSGVPRLQARRVDASGVPQAEVAATQGTGARTEPGGARGVLVHQEPSSCPTCGGRQQITLVHMEASTTTPACSGGVCPGKSVTLSFPSATTDGADARRPQVIELAPDIYMVAWLETNTMFPSVNIVNTVRIAWDPAGQAWKQPSLTLGFTVNPRDILGMALAGDGVFAGVAFDTLDLSTGASDIRFRATCP